MNNNFVIMDYEKKYKEAIERAKKLQETCDSQAVVGWCEYIFPEELKESEDEKVRKSIIGFLKTIASLKDGRTVSNEDFDSKELINWIAWLEKHGQEPRKVSIWKHWKDGICGNGEGKLIYLIKNGDDYSLSSSLGFECDYIELSELDNLMLEKKGTSYTKRDVDDAFVEGMALAKDELEKQGEQKPTWSEEDERAIGIIKMTLEHPYDMEGKWDRKFTLDWLKSLKDRYTWKPSDEQITVLELASKYERVFTPKQIDILIGLKEQLKKLKGE